MFFLGRNFVSGIEILKKTKKLFQKRGFFPALVKRVTQSPNLQQSLFKFKQRWALTTGIQAIRCRPNICFLKYKIAVIVCLELGL